MPEPKQRDRWDKLQVLLDPVGKIMTAVLVVLLGYYGNKALQQDQQRRAYVELLSRREEADGNLRKDMFGKVIDTFVTPHQADLDSRILDLELLAYNFHESIDLGPLLKQVYVQAWTDQKATTKQRKRLQNLAQEIVNRELVALTEAGCAQTGQVRFDQLEKDSVEAGFIQVDCQEKQDLPAKRLSADVMIKPDAADLRKQTEVDVVLHVKPLQGGKSQEEEDEFQFTVSPFDFPMMDNVRLRPGGGRVSIAMTRVDDGGVTLALVYFPDSRTSLRDKPFYDEVLKALERTPASR
ncbi:MAG: hypothetical protein LAN83_14250 [Acidobacteriia bacterium]|nr:hypothetical protein [Terriglobia bacterium]